MKNKLFLLLLPVIFLCSCEKDKAPELDPVYSQAVERTCGNESSMVQELSFNSNGSILFKTLSERMLV